MPPVTRGNFNSSMDLTSLTNKDFGYEYPFGLDLKPGSSTHNELRDRVLDLAQESRNIMVRRFDSWREIDRTMTAYIPLSEEEKVRQSADPRRPVSIVVPLSYASLQVLLTYMSAAFMEFPFFKYEGIGPEDIISAILMEHHISYQVQRKSLGLHMHTMWQDGYKYGVGPMAVEFIKDSRTTRRVVTTKGGLFTRDKVTEQDERRVIYEGNVFRPIDPYEYMPDTSFPAWDIESHQFTAWFERFNWMKLLDMEAANPESYFNVKYLEFIDGRSSLLRHGNSWNVGAEGDREDKSLIGKHSESTIYTKPIDVIPMYVDLVPKAWGLGNITDVETWVFKIAGDEVIIDAGPTNLSHGMKPVVACAPDFDGHSISDISRMELGYGLNTAVNFLYNSHITNVRKAVNNIFVVDPGLANYNDITDTREGAVIRMRKAVWGLGKIGDAVVQLAVNDVTANNMNDINQITQIARQVFGSQESISGGIAGKKERVSSAETRQAAQSALSRLEKDAKITFMQAHNPLAIMMAEHTAQNLSEERWVKISGTLPDDLKKELDNKNRIKNDRILLKPEDLESFSTDVLPSDGTIPGSHRDPQTLQQFFQNIANLPPEQLVQFDMVDIVTSIGRRMGVKEVQGWVSGQPPMLPQVESTIQDQGEINKQVGKGNMVPVNGGAL